MFSFTILPSDYPVNWIDFFDCVPLKGEKCQVPQNTTQHRHPILPLKEERKEGVEGVICRKLNIILHTLLKILQTPTHQLGGENIDRSFRAFWGCWENQVLAEVGQQVINYFNFLFLIGHISRPLHMTISEISELTDFYHTSPRGSKSKFKLNYSCGLTQNAIHQSLWSMSKHNDQCQILPINAGPNEINSWLFPKPMNKNLDTTFGMENMAMMAPPWGEKLNAAKGKTWPILGRENSQKAGARTLLPGPGRLPLFGFINQEKCRIMMWWTWKDYELNTKAQTRKGHGWKHHLTGGSGQVYGLLTFFFKI